MKKFYSYFNTLICFSFLFILNSCSANTSSALSTIPGTMATIDEINCYNPQIDETKLENKKNLCTSGSGTPNDLFVDYSATNSFPESNVICLTKTQIVDDIDPDWLKLIPHFSGRIEGVGQKV
jgi:hypothetical protein